jgi:PqqD family protein of HPr-rel-A system
MLSCSTSWGTLRLLWKQWGDECIVYNVTSGNTHLVNATVAKVLRRLDQQPGTLRELSEYLASEFDIDSDQEVIQHLEQLINHLDELGLIQSIS